MGVAPFVHCERMRASVDSVDPCSAVHRSAEEQGQRANHHFGGKESCLL